MAHVALSNAGLKFRLRSRAHRSFKETVINLLGRRRYEGAGDEIWAFRGVTLRIGEGERVGIVGDNGAGKSSLLKVIARIYRPTEGEVERAGFLVPLLDIRLGMSPELSVEENIFLMGAIVGLPRSAIERKITPVLSFCELERYAGHPVKYLSTGMAARLAFAAATEIDPEILLLDEIFSAGDIHWAEKGLARMEKLIDRSKIVLFVSHDMQHVLRYCTRVVWIRKGALARDGEPKEVVKAYQEGGA